MKKIYKKRLDNQEFRCSTAKVPSNVIGKDVVTLVCETHGEFQQRWDMYIQSSGCKKCLDEKNTIPKHEKLNRIKKANNNQDPYDYSLVHELSKWKDKVTLVCQEHGAFEMVFGLRLRGIGCKKCKENTLNKYLSRAQTKHNNKYEYPGLTNDTKTSDKITISCPTHGEFVQELGSHMSSGRGCPSCVSKSTSTGEEELARFVSSIVGDVERNNRTILSGRELDIYIPSMRLAIEYCGIYWHSEQMGKDKNYHKSKMEDCNKQGIRLITIFEDEWICKQNIIKTLIANITNSQKHSTYARKCEIVEVPISRRREFLNKHHILGDVGGTNTIGLEHDSRLVACMVFAKNQHGWYLTRFATEGRVVGGFSKLMKYATNHLTHDETIISFADLRWSVGDLYEKNGWKQSGILLPDYTYSVNGKSREHKFRFRRSGLRKKLPNFDESLSEWENCKNNNVLRIWDCGKIRYEFNGAT